MVDDIKPHIIGITESWANNDITYAELGLEGYAMFRKDRMGRRGLDLLDLKLLLVIQRRGHTTKNGSSVDAMLGDTNCLYEGEVDDCEVLRYAVQPPSSWTAPWSRPADSARGEVVQFQYFTFGWHTMQVTEPAQSTLRQGDIDGALFSLLSDIDVSYMLIPFDIFESAQAAHVKCIQSIVITDVQVPRLRSI